MRTSHLYVILLSALVVQISSDTTAKPAELDKLFKSILSSSFEIAAKPIVDFVNIIPVNIDKYLTEFTQRLRDFMEQAKEEFLNAVPNEDRQNKKKMIGYTEITLARALSKVEKSVTTTMNKSFDTLPDNIKTQLLDIGKEIDDFLKKIWAENRKDSKTSQKTPEEY